MFCDGSHGGRIHVSPVQKAFESLGGGFKGRRELLVFQMIRLSEEFFTSDKVVIPSAFHRDPLRRRILIALSIDRIVQHLVRFMTKRAPGVGIRRG